MPAMTWNEPLDPFVADAVKRSNKRFQQENASPSPYGQLLQTLILRMIPELIGMSTEQLFRLMASRAPMSAKDQADLDLTRAQTKATLAQAENRADENDPRQALRNTISLEEAKSGNVRGALDIAEGRMEPGAAPTIVDRAAERRTGDVGRMVEASHQATDRPAGVRNLGEQIVGQVGDIREAHPGPAGEQLARDIGELGVQEMYSRPGMDKAELDERVRQALLIKLAQFGKGQEGVTEDEVRRGILKDTPTPGFYQRGVGAIPANKPKDISRQFAPYGWHPGL